MNCVIDLWRPHHRVRLLGQSEVGSAVELSCPCEEVIVEAAEAKEPTASW